MRVVQNVSASSRTHLYARSNAGRRQPKPSRGYCGADFAANPSGCRGRRGLVPNLAQRRHQRRKMLCQAPAGPTLSSSVTARAFDYCNRRPASRVEFRLSQSPPGDQGPRRACRKSSPCWAFICARPALLRARKFKHRRVHHHCARVARQRRQAPLRLCNAVRG